MPPIQVQYDHLKQTYTITSPNPNLMVARNYNAPGNIDAPQPGSLLGFGFSITVSPSFIQVARFQGRYLLRDGHHRSFGLLKRGITRVPAYVRDFATARKWHPPRRCPAAPG